ncbi:hypothetical protein CHELA20_53264 [Hyphomicrobiales bacterium]|nr:hypothetical protein CHELA20_53264 [Hyphomicrobiales bacterium]
MRRFESSRPSQAFFATMNLLNLPKSGRECLAADEGVSANFGLEPSRFKAP